MNYRKLGIITVLTPDLNSLYQISGNIISGEINLYNNYAVNSGNLSISNQYQSVLIPLNSGSVLYISGQSQF